jgi:hypothetical protein
MITQHRNATMCLLALLAALLIFWSPVTSLAQGSGVSAALSIDTSVSAAPVLLSLKTNTRTDITAIRVTKSGGKFSVLIAAIPEYKMLPTSDVSFELRMNSDTGGKFPVGTNLSIARIRPDSSTRQVSLHVEFFNSNDQSVAEQTLLLTVPLSTPLTGPCAQNFLSLATGINHVTGGMYSSGAVDPYWKIIAVGPLTGSSGVGPTPAPSFASYYSSGTGFITCLPVYGACVNEPECNYTYQRSFCAVSASPAMMSMVVHAFDSAAVYFNGSLVPLGSSNRLLPSSAFTWDNMFVVNAPIAITAGTNTVEVRLYHRGPPHPNVFRIISGGITSTVPANLVLTSDNCCTPKGTIGGHKYWDLNCNGVLDPGEPGVAGWTVTLTPPSGPPQTATTNASGAYLFTNLLAGTYTVTEGTSSGWINGATTTYSIVLGPSQSVMRDFLNCKTPDCKNLFTEEEKDPDCCQYNFDISNGGGALSKIEYTATGGTVSFISTEPCFPSSTTPALLFGTTSGTLNYSPTCNSPLEVRLGAVSTTATGLICVHWKFTFQLGTGSFVCDTNICYQCKRMPKDCGQAISVQPYLFGPLDQDYRTFKITNVKLPVSQISSVDVKFTPVPQLGYHVGGGLVVDNMSRTWGVPSSGGPTNPYTQVRLNCAGGVTALFPSGAAANTSVAFNLGVDNTTVPLYSGIVHIKIGYCDGDTCEYDYVWNKPAPSGIGSFTSPKLTGNPRIFNVSVVDLDSAASFSVSLKDSATTILAITAPQPDDVAVGTLVGYNVKAARNAALYVSSANITHKTGNTNIVTVVFTPSQALPPDSVPVVVRWFDASGRQIASSEKVIAVRGVSAVNHDVQPGMIGVGMQLDIRPNPATTNATITLELEKNEVVSLAIYDITGKEMQSVLSGSALQSGHHTFEVITSGLAKGTYMLSARTSDNRVVTTQLKVVR